MKNSKEKRKIRSNKCHFREVLMKKIYVILEDIKMMWFSFCDVIPNTLQEIGFSFKKITFFDFNFL